MYLLVLYFPLLSFLLISFFGRFFGRQGSSVIAFSLMFLTTLIAWFSLFEIGFSKSLVHLSLFTWLNLDTLVVN
jgi:NADH:ubiquinone oxidoreductase subunit 5 (subunit L)/multisubunit Na+/H+ antiporter MnhA subunit